VVCIDFNNEFIQELKPIPESIISEEVAKKLFLEIEKLNTELSKFENNQNKSNINDFKKNIFNFFQIEISDFLNLSQKKVKVFELPEISNNRNSLDYTRYFFDTLFKLQKENSNRKICVVLEEAHTIIPEWNFA